MLSCKEATALVSESQDRNLGLRERIALRFHLFICVLCRRYARQIEIISRTVRSGGDAVTPHQNATLDPAARERIRSKLR